MDAKFIWNGLQTVATLLGGGIGWFLGGFDGLLYALVALVAADYCTGLMCAIIEKKLSSEIGRRGILKKVLIFLLVGVAHIIDYYAIGDTSVLRTATILFFISNEGLSCVENACRIGLPVPKKLKDILSQLHRANKEDDE